MMKFDEFVLAFTEGFRDYLPPEFQNAEIWAEKVVKTNDQILTGINIRRDGDIAAPRIYIDGMYEEYLHGKPIEAVFQDAEKTWSSALEQAPAKGFIENLLKDREKALGMVSYRILNQKANEAYLEGRPWTPMADLACVYQLELGCGQRAPISNKQMDNLGLTVQELHDLAMENTQKLLPASVKTMGDALGFPSVENDLMVITNSDMVDGAGTILYPGIKEQIMERLGGDFWILPCSVHEVLAARKNEDVPLEHLQRMVRDINSSAVIRPQDVLSNEVYELKGQELTIARDTPSLKKNHPARDDDAR